MRILSAATALPGHYYPQEVLVEAFRQHWGVKLDRFSVVERLHSATKVDGRYLTLPLEAYPDLKRWGEANNIWIDAAQRLGEQAISQAAAEARVDLQDLAACFFV